MDKFKNKSEEEWKRDLTHEEYRILREKGTERPFSGEYLNNKEDGIYVCRGCGTEIFSSDTKFNSDTGWPSFFDVIDKAKPRKARSPDSPKGEFGGNVLLQKDNVHGMKRTEVTCANCGGHLGHVFPDGPIPTGKRYCINSVSLDFKER